MKKHMQQKGEKIKNLQKMKNMQQKGEKQKTCNRRVKNKKRQRKNLVPAYHLIDYLLKPKKP